MSVHVLETGGAAPLSKFWQVLPGELRLPDCHVTPSTDAEAFLFWSPGRILLAWAPSSGVYTACIYGT